jgi:hypothetical protein
LISLPFADDLRDEKSLIDYAGFKIEQNQKGTID